MQTVNVVSDIIYIYIYIGMNVVHYMYILFYNINIA